MHTFLFNILIEKGKNEKRYAKEMSQFVELNKKLYKVLFLFR